MNRYDDIIEEKWPRQSMRPRMSLEQRAKIFLPFQALTGYETALDKTRMAEIESMEQKSGMIKFEEDIFMDQCNPVWYIKVNLCNRKLKNGTIFIKRPDKKVNEQEDMRYAKEIQRKPGVSSVSIGLADEARSLQSKKGRQKVLDTLESNNDYVLEAQSVKLMLEIIDTFAQKIKIIEKQLEELTKDDEMVKLLLTIRGCGKITAWIIRAYTEDISRFANSKKYAAFCGLVPKVKDSNETVHHGSITRHGPVELRTAFVQLFMGMRRCKDTKSWRMMQRYEYMKKK